MYAGCMQVVCRLYAGSQNQYQCGCMQVIHFFSLLTIFVIKKLYIKNICKKSVTSVTTNTSACYRGVTEV